MCCRLSHIGENKDSVLLILFLALLLEDGLGYAHIIIAEHLRIMLKRIVIYTFSHEFLFAKRQKNINPLHFNKTNVRDNIQRMYCW